MNMGTKIKTLREEYGFTQGNIAKFLGVDQSFISKIENNERTLTSKMLTQLASLFCVEMSDILSDNKVTAKTSYAFRASNLSADDLIAISRINKIVLNANFMTKVLGE